MRPKGHETGIMFRAFLHIQSMERCHSMIRTHFYHNFYKFSSHIKHTMYHIGNWHNELPDKTAAIPTLTE